VEQVAAARPLALDLMNSVRLTADDRPIEPLDIVYELPEEHVRRGEWRFNFPAGWFTEEQSSYTLLVPPGLQTTLGLSTPHWPSEAEAADIDRIMGSQMESVLDALPDSDYELIEIDLNGVRALRLDINDEAENFGYSMVMAHSEGTWIHNLTFVGTPGEIALLEGLIPDLLLSMRPVDSTAK
jgi:hypothetical protein